MKIDFKLISQEKIELKNGNILDLQILNLYDHDAFANGEGWIDLPEELINGKFDFKGTTDKELPKMDGKGNIITTLPIEEGFTGDPAATNGLYSIPGQPIRVTPVPQQLQEEYVETYIQQVLGSWTEEMLSKFFERVRAELLRRNEFEYKMLWKSQRTNEEVMEGFGFHRRTNDRWYHPVLGIDSLENWLKFNPQTDNVSQVATMLFKSGWVKGQFKTRMDIKVALDIR